MPEWSFEEFRKEDWEGAPITFGSNLPEYQQMIEDHGGLGPSVKTLLIGVGSKTSAAEWQRLLHQQGVRVSQQIVCDIRKGPLKDSQNLWREGYQEDDMYQTFERMPKVSFVQGDGLKLPFPAEAFDAIFTHLLALNVGDFESVLRNAKRVLKPNGKLFLIEHLHAFGGQLGGEEERLIREGKNRAEEVLGKLGFKNIEVFPTVGVTRRQYMELSGRRTHETAGKYVDRTPSKRLAVYAEK